MTSIVSQVIIVDDEEAIRSAIGQSLELEGYTVSRCASGDEALGIVSRGWAGIVVTDVKMPDMDGFVLMARLHRVDAELPVVMLTGHGDVLMAVTAMGRGAYDFIEKPCPTRSSDRGRRQSGGKSVPWFSKTAGCAIAR